MGKKFNKQDAYGQLLLDADLGAAADEMDLNLRTKAPTLKKMAIRRRMELESMGEELRVLYVAMTRAKEVLVMTGTDRSLENKLEKWDQLSLTDGQIPYTVLSGANSFLDWVLMAKAAVPAGHMEVKQVQLTHLIGRELQRQLEKKNVKEELLKLDTKQVYDEQMKEQLDQHQFLRLQPFSHFTGRDTYHKLALPVKFSFLFSLFHPLTQRTFQKFPYIPWKDGLIGFFCKKASLKQV